MSLSAAPTAEPTMPALRFFDVVLVVVAAPILLLIGVPALGYLVGAGAWIALRAVGVAAERVVQATPDASRQIALRLGYMLGRLFALALAIILVRQDVGRDDGLTALLVIVVAFTIALGLSAVNRPRSR